MQKKLIIDANLLLLLVIGTIDNGIHIEKSKRLNNYNKRDLELLLKLLSQFRYFYITPYLITEVSNLLDLKHDLRNKAFLVAREIFNLCTVINVNVHTDVNSDSFITHGITDASLVNLVKDHIILTNDDRMLPLLYEANSDNVIPFKLLNNFIS